MKASQDLRCLGCDTAIRVTAPSKQLLFEIEHRFWQNHMGGRHCAAFPDVADLRSRDKIKIERKERTDAS